MKVECINDKKQTFGGVKTPYGDLISYGDFYEVEGEYISKRGVKMFLLVGMRRNDDICGDGWAQKRFREVRRKTEKKDAKVPVSVTV